MDYNNETIDISDWVSVGGNSDKITYHREAMGLGDVKYMAMIVFIDARSSIYIIYSIYYWDCCKFAR